MSDNYKAYFDGASLNNPGEAGIGAVIYKNNKKIWEHSEPVGIKTSNEAEYMALIKLLEKLINIGVNKVSIFGDSQLIVNQVNGEWKVKQKHLKPLCSKAKKIIKRIPGAKLEWVQRDKNKIADALSKVALKKAV